MGHALGNNYGKFYSMLSKPVLVDCQFTVDSTNTNGLGVKNVKGQGINNVFMHTTQTPASNNGYLNPNPAAGFALIQLAYNYTRYYGGFTGFASPSTGGNIAINASALTAGQPYIISAVGHGNVGVATIAPVADVAGSLAGTWFNLYDNYGNHFVIWFSVDGVGSAPSGTGGILVQQSITASDSAATIGGLLATTIAALPSGTPGVFSFTTAGTTTVTCTSTLITPQTPLPGVPSEGTVPTGFTFALTKYTSNLSDWQHVGVPKGVVPAVGVSFVATATGYSTGGGSTGTVVLPGNSATFSAEVVGDPNLSFGPIPMGGSPNVGGWILLQFLAPTISTSFYETPILATAPTDLSIFRGSFYVEQAARVGGNNE